MIAFNRPIYDQFFFEDYISRDYLSFEAIWDKPGRLCRFIDRLKKQIIVTFNHYFFTYFPFFRGKAQYGSAVVLSNDTSGHGPRVLTSHFAAHHTVLRTTEDFIEAIRKARQLSDEFGPRWAKEDELAGDPKFTQTESTSKLISKPRGPQPNSVFPYR